MNQASLVSIIVPVYNAEKFVSNTISSITAQTYENIEIIIINDGSTDNSGSICDKLASGDTRIRVIHQENLGVSNARNAGINESKGFYISFVDADDLIDSFMIERMVEVMVRENVDIVVAQHTEKQFKKHDKSVKCDMLLSGFYDTETFRDIIVTDYLKRRTKKFIPPYRNTGSPFQVGCCGKLFKSEIIKDKAIVFDPNLKIGEDALFIYEYISKANRFYVINNYYPYIYIRHDESATAQYEPNKYKRRKHLFDKFKEIFNCNFPDNFDQVYFYFALEMYYSFPMLPFKKNSKLIRTTLKKILNDKDLDRSFQHVNKKTLKNKDRVLFYLFKKKNLQILLLILWIREKLQRAKAVIMPNRVRQTE